MLVAVRGLEIKKKFYNYKVNPHMLKALIPKHRMRAFLEGR